MFGVWFSKNDIALVAALDGTIYFVEASSRKILWSFASGSSIYSSYQAFLDGDNDKQLSTDFFIDCGDDWELYRHNISFGKRVCKLNFYLYAFGGECIDNNNPNCMVLATYVIKKHSSLV